MMEGEMGIFKPMFKPIFDFSSYIPPKFDLDLSDQG